MNAINIKLIDVSRTDITHYSEGELSLLVFNDENLYRMRHSRDFIDILDLLFIYTPEQLAELKQDLIDDKNYLRDE